MDEIKAVGPTPFSRHKVDSGNLTSNEITHPGGRIADRSESRGLIRGYGATLILLVPIGVPGSNLAILLPCLFGVRATMMFAMPTIQVRLTTLAPDAPTLMGALNLAALNLANSLGVIGGAITLDAGQGTLSTVSAGFVLTRAGLPVFRMRRGLVNAGQFRPNRIHAVRGPIVTLPAGRTTTQP